jgi:hypothetical protein
MDRGSFLGIHSQRLAADVPSMATNRATDIYGPSQKITKRKQAAEVGISMRKLSGVVPAKTH